VSALDRMIENYRCIDSDACRSELAALREENEALKRDYAEAGEDVRRYVHANVALSSRVADLEMTLRGRDALWCEALLPEETRTIERVTRRYNEARKALGNG
jgi:hypothetical protein